MKGTVTASKDLLHIIWLKFIENFSLASDFYENFLIKTYQSLEIYCNFSINFVN